MGFKPSYTDRSNSNLRFVYVFMLTRVVYLLIVFFIPSSWVQLCLTIFLFEGVIMYMAWHMPMHGKWNNYLMIFNLCSVMFCLYHMICFSDFVEKVGEYEMGFSFLLTIFTFVCVNMLFAAMGFVRVIMLLGENRCGFLRLYLHPCQKYFSMKWGLFMNCVEMQLNKWGIKLNCISHFKKYIDYLQRNQTSTRQKPKVEIVQNAIAHLEDRPPTPPPVPKLKIVKKPETPVNEEWQRI